MPEEEAVQQTETEPMDDFSRTMGQNLGESTPEADVTPEADSTPAFDWSTVNLETIDPNSVPDDVRPAVEAAQRRVREMSSGVGKKLSEVTDYENQLKEMKAEIEALRNPPEPAYEPGKAEMVAEKLGYDLDNATPQARDSFAVVNQIVEGHPLIESLQQEIATLKEQLGPATEYVQKARDGEKDAQYEAAVEAYGKDVVDNHLDAANALVGVTDGDGTPFDLHRAIGRVSGVDAKVAEHIDAKAKAAKNGAVKAAAGVSGVPGGEGDMSDAEIDKQIHKLLS